MEAKIDLTSQLLRELEAEIGSRDLSEMVIKSLIDSVKSLKVKEKGSHFQRDTSCDSPSLRYGAIDCFLEEFNELFNLIKNTQPRFGALNFHFSNLLKYISEDICKNKKCNMKWRKMIIKKLQEKVTWWNKQRKRIQENAMKIDVEGKTILIHDHSHTVQDVLVHYKNKGKKFRVIIAEQDFDKTHDNIERLHRARIPFQVIPSYMLSHVHDQIDMAFFGALTFKSTMNFVMAPGTHGVISEFHVAKVPIYVFMECAKFSLWKSELKKEMFMHKHKRDHCFKPITYDRIKYSHDRVPHKLFTKVVTNEGVFTPAGLKKLFDERMKKYGVKI